MADGDLHKKGRRRSNFDCDKCWRETSCSDPAGAAVSRKRKLYVNEGKYKQRGTHQGGYSLYSDDRNDRRIF